MPSIQDIYRLTEKQTTPKEIGIAGIRGGALGGAMGGAIGKMGGLAKQIMEALKKRKKLPKFPTAPERRPEPPVQMPRPAPKIIPPIYKGRFPLPKPTMIPLKQAKEQEDLNKKKRWQY